jgi:hypothetical protein
MGYRPTGLFALDEARSATLRRATVLVASLLVLSAFLGAITYASVQSTEFEADARATVEDVAAAHDLSVVSVTFDYEGFPVRRPSEVVVVLGHSPGEAPPRVAPAIRDRLNGATTDPFGLTDPRVAVAVQHVVLERAGASTTPASTVPAATTPARDPGPGSDSGPGPGPGPGPGSASDDRSDRPRPPGPATDASTTATLSVA